MLGPVAVSGDCEGKGGLKARGFRLGWDEWVMGSLG
jgi:hypothetical protein